jgi:hypothetical protein
LGEERPEVRVRRQQDATFRLGKGEHYAVVRSAQSSVTNVHSVEPGCAQHRGKSR